MDDVFWTTMVIVLVGTVVLILCREVTCWYFKINTHLKLQEEISQSLQKLIEAGKKQGPVLEMSPEEWASKFNISESNGKYHYKNYQYDSVEDAINYAKQLELNT